MQEKPSNILLIYTGGTIGMIRDYETGALKAFNFDELLANIPELRLLEHYIDTVSFDEPIDSSNMKPEYYIQIGEMINEHYDNYDGFVVLHGSDTMAYSASAVSFLLENLSKPVIFTGSQLPIGDLRTDAKENLITSIELAGKKKNGKNIINEVGLYFEYELYRANRTTKINAQHFEAFASMNYLPIAESGVELKIHEKLLHKISRRRDLIFHRELDRNIIVLKIFPGFNQAIFEAALTIPNLKGVILETYGSGNAPNEPWFLESIQKLIENDILVVNVTQCAGGSVDMGAYATSTELKQMGVIAGNDITTEAAVAKMMYLIPKKLGNTVFKTIFETSLRGEMS